MKETVELQLLPGECRRDRAPQCGSTRRLHLLPGECGRDRVPQCGCTRWLCSYYLVNAEETERHNVAAPGGCAVAAAGAGRDASSIKHNSHVVVPLALATLVERLWGIHCRTQVKTCRNIGIFHVFVFYSFF